MASHVDIHNAVIVFTFITFGLYLNPPLEILRNATLSGPCRCVKFVFAIHTSSCPKGWIVTFPFSSAGFVIRAYHIWCVDVSLPCFLMQYCTNSI